MGERPAERSRDVHPILRAARFSKSTDEGDENATGNEESRHFARAVPLETQFSAPVTQRRAAMTEVVHGYTGPSCNEFCRLLPRMLPYAVSLAQIFAHYFDFTSFIFIRVARHEPVHPAARALRPGRAT